MIDDSNRALGVGVDLVECYRIENLFQKQAKAFLDKIYTEEEIEYCMRFKNPIPSLSARFAAKEAVSKAFGTGIGEDLDWKSVSIFKDEREAPRVRLDDKGNALLEKMGGRKVLISLTHTESHAMAYAHIC